MSALYKLITRAKGMSPKALQQTVQQANSIIGNRIWVPNPGPQTEAYVSLADVLLYGGKAGGGKTHLELGWGINEADRGIIFRRELTQTDGIESEGKAIIGTGASFNGSDREWVWQNGKSLKLGAMSAVNDWIKHAGRERDYMAFDEAGEFLEVQVASIMASLRAAPGKRTRIVLASNPPRTSDGLWLLAWFAPWLDTKHPDPAAPGELRWGCYVKDHIEWVEKSGEYAFGPGADSVSPDEAAAAGGSLRAGPARLRKDASHTAGIQGAAGRSESQGLRSGQYGKGTTSG